MSAAPFRIEPLGKHHNRTSFECGEPALDHYLKTQVSQDIRRHVANCFVLLEDATRRIAGFYTLSAASIPLVDLPADEAKGLPRYPTLPAIRIGRLAIDRSFHGRGLGAALLADAARRAIDADAAAYALLVDAKNAAAVRFYQHHGFLILNSHPTTLFLPVATAKKALAATAAH